MIDNEVPNIRFCVEGSAPIIEDSVWIEIFHNRREVLFSFLRERSEDNNLWLMCCSMSEEVVCHQPFSSASSHSLSAGLSC